MITAILAQQFKPTLSAVRVNADRRLASEQSPAMPGRGRKYLPKRVRPPRRGGHEQLGVSAEGASPATARPLLPLRFLGGFKMRPPFFSRTNISLEEWIAANPDGCALPENRTRGYDLDKLVGHPDWRIRAAVAKQGYGLEKLVCDQDALVLIAVADQGYGLDLLVKDWRQSVSLAARKRLRDCGMNIEQWIEANPDRCALPENRAMAQVPTLSGAKAAQKGRQKVEQGKRFKGEVR